jgi:hypothetical protein
MLHGRIAQRLEACGVFPFRIGSAAGGAASPRLGLLPPQRTPPRLWAGRLGCRQRGRGRPAAQIQESHGGRLLRSHIDVQRELDAMIQRETGDESETTTAPTTKRHRFSFLLSHALVASCAGGSRSAARTDRPASALEAQHQHTVAVGNASGLQGARRNVVEAERLANIGGHLALLAGGGRNDQLAMTVMTPASVGLVVPTPPIERCLCSKSRHIPGVHVTTAFGWLGLTVSARGGQTRPPMSSTRVSRHVNAPGARVHSALVDANAIARWKVPTGMP